MSDPYIMLDNVQNIIRHLPDAPPDGLVPWHIFVAKLEGNIVCKLPSVLLDSNVLLTCLA